MDKVQEETPTLTPAGDFRRGREQGEIITLPSTGRVVKMRVVKPRQLLVLGKIPNPLAEIAVRLLYGQMTSEQYNSYFTVDERKEQAADMAESLRVVCTAALLYPRIVDEPQADDEIHIDDLEDAEQRNIFDLALLEASQLSRFRERQTELVEPVEQRESDEQPTE